jgi:hypothetical protein
MRKNLPRDCARPVQAGVPARPGDADRVGDWLPGIVVLRT